MDTRLQPLRPFGATGVIVPLIGYGTAPLGKKQITRDHAERCLNYAIDSGITYLDTSPDYGSEPHVGAVMRTRRQEVFLATKVNRRSKQGVLDELQESLDRLHPSPCRQRLGRSRASPGSRWRRGRVGRSAPAGDGAFYRYYRPCSARNSSPRLAHISF